MLLLLLREHGGAAALKSSINILELISGRFFSLHCLHRLHALTNLCDGIEPGWSAVMIGPHTAASTVACDFG